MLTVPVSREMPVRTEIVWELLVDTHRWSDWGPSVGAVETADRRIGDGSSGRLRTPFGVWVPFRVTNYEEGHQWAWSVAGVPATTHRVQPTEHGCRVTFGVPAPAVAYSLVCALALRRIERLGLTEEPIAG